MKKGRSRGVGSVGGGAAALHSQQDMIAQGHGGSQSVWQQQQLMQQQQHYLQKLLQQQQQHHQHLHSDHPGLQPFESMAPPLHQQRPTAPAIPSLRSKVPYHQQLPAHPASGGPRPSYSNSTLLSLFPSDTLSGDRDVYSGAQAGPYPPVLYSFHPGSSIGLNLVPTLGSGRTLSRSVSHTVHRTLGQDSILSKAWIKEPLG